VDPDPLGYIDRKLQPPQWWDGTLAMIATTINTTIIYIYDLCELKFIAIISSTTVTQIPYYRIISRFHDALRRELRCARIHAIFSNHNNGVTLGVPVSSGVEVKIQGISGSLPP